MKPGKGTLHLITNHSYGSCRLGRESSVDSRQSCIVITIVRGIEAVLVGPNHSLRLIV